MKSRLRRKRPHRPLSDTLPLVSVSALALALLSGCGGGADGSGGGDQSPDPVVVDLPVAYIERPLPVDDNGNPVLADMLDPTQFNPGAALYIKDRATPGALATDITSAAFALDPEADPAADPDALVGGYDVKDVEVSSDGSLLVFAMRAPDIPGLDPEDQPSWNIWEYNLDTDTLRRIISSDTTAEEGQDLDPAYLPDGRIVFTSTRQRRSKAILLDDNKPQFAALDEDRNREALLLHVMEPDGTDIDQITYNQSHDLQPTVLEDGRILFNRWDNYGNNAISLYTVSPSGAGLAPYYGYHSQNTGSGGAAAVFQQPRPMPDGRILATLKGRDGRRYGGDMVLIDGENFTEIDQPTAANLGAAGPGQESASALPVSTDPDTISRHGVFSSVFPLFDGTNRLLVSWSQCRVINPDNQLIQPCTDALLARPDVTEADPLFGLWIYNLDNQSQQPLVKPVEGRVFTEAVTLEPRSGPTFIPDPVGGVDVDEALVEQGVGVLHIRSIYDLDGTDSTALGIPAFADPAQTPASQRRARFLRLVKAVSLPDRDVFDINNTAFGRSSAQGMREILGYVPIEPDGSVKAKVPADVAFTVAIVDAQGRRIGGRHENWLSLRPGEARECSGCHTSASERPHGRLDAEPESANAGASASGQPFANTNPVLLPEAGESMAETFARLDGLRTPSVNLQFTDEWNNGVLAPAAPIALTYADLDTPAPAPGSCQTNWTSLCRTTIHYPDHLQPLWDLDRQIFDAAGTLIEDRTCTSCHGTRDAAGAPQVPAQQLDLSAAASPDQADHLISYRELLFGDVEQELDENGALVDRLIQATDGNGNPLFQVDEDGEPLLDVDGNPVPVLITVGVPAPMNTRGALASGRFFAPFANGADHAGYLTPAELRLISEWLDIGAQYYNNPFDFPIN